MTLFPHGGNLRRLARTYGKDVSQLVDFSANINPFGPPSWLRPTISSAISNLVNYPDPENTDFREAVAAKYNAEPGETLVGNGSTELIYMIPRALGKKKAIIVSPCYADYVTSCIQSGLYVKHVLSTPEKNFIVDVDELDATIGGDELVFLGHPNNPTGVGLDRDSITELAGKYPDTIFVIDEAFVDLSSGVQSFTEKRLHNIVIIISLTKTFCIPGLRLGCGIAGSGLVNKIVQFQPPWSVNTLAQMIGTRALSDTDYINRSVGLVERERTFLQSRLREIGGLVPFSSCANFILIRISRRDIDSGILVSKALERGVAIRDCANFHGLDSTYIRIAVRTREENIRLLETLGMILGHSSSKTRSSRVKTLMFQGTSSNAGKSVLTAAFCRILSQDGINVAPFKSQNMSLNSFVTNQGLEMGRAQAFQAQACGLEPDVRMNPVLLKPNSDTGSQVIVMGKPVRNMNVSQYIEYKPEAFQHACRAFDELAKKYDAIILEGAGSPAEINLKNHDIVNMNMARYAESPVIIVGDIDRGGVFASFIGSMEVLDEWERKLTLGFLINKFRGDQTILDPALEYTLDFTGKPVLGVVPFIGSLGLPEEDSVTFRSGFFDDKSVSGNHVEIVIIDLPHISNFTDFDALRNEPDVRIRVVRSPGELGNPDAIIIPGSKNVISDLNHLKKIGLADLILNAALTKKSEVVGICGGFQMIGNTIKDLHHIESDAEGTDGLGLLNLSTVLELDKTLRFTHALHIDSRLELHGYEIHHGKTEAMGEKTTILGADGTDLGYGSSEGMIWGTYLHGVFDADEFRRHYINKLRARKGLMALSSGLTRYDLNPAFDKLAEIVRGHVRIEKIYEAMGL